nr:hypothetical protein Iba_scaffold5911CG0010 [Ipomoea batatas]
MHNQGEEDELVGEESSKQGLCTPAACEMTPMNSGAVEIEQLRGVEYQCKNGLGLEEVGEEARLLGTSSDGEFDTQQGEEQAKKHKKSGFKIPRFSVNTKCNGSKSSSLSLETWLEGLKGKLGHEEVNLQLVEEVKQDVKSFENSFVEQGRRSYGRNLHEFASQAASLLLGKLQGKKQEDELISDGSSKKLSKEEGVVSEEQCSATVGECFDNRELEEGVCCERNDDDCSAVGEEGYVDDVYSADNEDCTTDGKDDYLQSDDEYDDREVIEEDTNIDNGEYDEYEFNCDEWLDWLEKGLRYVRGVNLMNEVLKEIFSYMQVVYDEQQQVHWEEEGSMALKGCIILREIVKSSPVRGLLHLESELGYQLLMNEEAIGRRLCRWAWRRYRGDWEEKLKRLDVNYYCN